MVICMADCGSRRISYLDERRVEGKKTRRSGGWMDGLGNGVYLNR